MVPKPRRWIASCFLAGKGGEKTTESDLRTPRGRVTRTTSAVKIPLLVETVTPVSSDHPGMMKKGGPEGEEREKERYGWCAGFKKTSWVCVVCPVSFFFFLFFSFRQKSFPAIHPMLCKCSYENKEEGPSAMKKGYFIIQRLRCYW